MATVEQILAKQADEPLTLKVAEGSEAKLQPIVEQAVTASFQYWSTHP